MINEKFDGKKLGFGLMRLPMKNNNEVDIDEVIKMADLFSDILPPPKDFVF